MTGEILNSNDSRHGHKCQTRIFSDVTNTNLCEIYLKKFQIQSRIRELIFRFIIVHRNSFSGAFSMTGTHDPNGEGACELCYAGEYSSLEGALEFCEMCPAGQTSLEGKDGIWENGVRGSPSRVRDRREGLRWVEGLRKGP